MRIIRVAIWTATAISALCVSQAVAKEKAPAASQQSASQKDQQVQAAQARLSSTEWAIELSPMSGEKGKAAIKDTLVFEKGKVQSRQLASAGFPATNYTLTVGDDGVAVWETMQTGSDTSVAFWRGELHGEAMRGILSKHPAKGNSMDMAFSGQFSGAAAAGAIPEPVAVTKVETQAAQAPAAGAAAPPAATPKTTKKKEDKKTR
ncbi:MAG: hypothetical protein HY594_00090 [Candidatus Omnitrophica bacterium]|nr:hypothetical protein [Candidatus Omnitrophota bacterium]